MPSFFRLTGTFGLETLSTNETGYVGSAAVIGNFAGFGDNIDVRIHGAVTGENGTPILQGTGNSLFVGRTGVIDNQDMFNQSRAGVEIVETGMGISRLSNAGQITGSFAAVTASVNNLNGNLRIANDGTMQGEVAGLWAVGMGRVNIVNNGTITGFDYGVTNSVELTPGFAAISLTNRGIIEGAAFAVRTSVGADTIINRGLLAGNVETGDGSDRLDNRGGRIEGDVRMGAGQDLFDNRGGDFFEFNVDLGADDDVFRPGAGAELVEGGAGARDLIDLSHSTGGIIDLAGGRGTGLAAGDLYFEFEDVLGSAGGADVIFGNASANELSGLGGNDLLDGGAGADRLDGGTGNDTMLGGAGNDTYIVDSIGDRVFETTTVSSTIDAGGIDTVHSAVSFNLDAGAELRFVERLLLTGGGAINGTGNALANIIIGTSGANTLNGGAGNDVLTGGAGADVFVFNTALGPSNIDRITDFNALTDTIILENAIFTGLANGTLAETAFASNTTGTAADASDRIIFETDTGRLYFDSDGTGAAARVHFATLGTGTSVTHADFLVV